LAPDNQLANTSATINAVAQYTERLTGPNPPVSLAKTTACSH